MKNFNYLQKVAKSASRFSNFEGGMGVSNNLSQLNRTITAVITNASDVASTYVLFGYNANGTAPTQGNGVTVAINETSYAQVATEIANSPYELVSAKYSTTVTGNLSNLITYTVSDATGASFTLKATPLNYQEPENNQSLLVRIPDFNGMILDGQTTLSGAIAANSTITLILSIKAKGNLSNALNNQNVVVSTAAPAPSGQAPVQLVVGPSIDGMVATGGPATQPGVNVQPTANSRFYR